MKEEIIELFCKGDNYSKGKGKSDIYRPTSLAERTTLALMITCCCDVQLFKSEFEFG